jgi:hypothetical protein
MSGIRPGGTIPRPGGSRPGGSRPGGSRPGGSRPGGSAGVLSPSALAALLLLSTAIGAPPRFVRSYMIRDPAHLSIFSINGNITVTAWNRRESSIRAFGPPDALIEDRVIGNTVAVSAGPSPRLPRVDFEASVPAGTSIFLKNKKGNIYVYGLTGHVDVDSGDGNIQLVNLRSSSIEAKLICGDVFFDGELAGDGPYSFQSIKGDIDVALPARSSFNLLARAMTENINVGGFLLNLSRRHPKLISGSHNNGGPVLDLMTYDGRIMLHKK